MGCSKKVSVIFYLEQYSINAANKLEVNGKTKHF